MYEPEEKAMEFSSKRAAEDYAYQRVIEAYDDFVGMYGILTVEEIMKEEDVDESDAEQIFNDNRESELDYKVVLVKENKEKEEIKKNAGT